MQEQATGFLDLSVSDWLEQIACEQPAPGGGSVAAIVVAMAAGLLAMAARFSREHWEEAPGIVAQAEALRARVAPLAQADAEAYEQVLVALRLPRDMDAEARNTTIGNALERAAEVPLVIVDEAANVALLAALVAENGNPNLRGDAVSAAVFAQAGARAAANLVAINLGTTEADERIVRARKLVATAAEAVEQALAAGA